MSVPTLATVADQLKFTYPRPAEGMEYTFAVEAEARDSLRKRKREDFQFQGGKPIIPIQVGGSFSARPFADGSAFPKGGTPTTKLWQISTRGWADTISLGLIAKDQTTSANTNIFNTPLWAKYMADSVAQTASIMERTLLGSVAGSFGVVQADGVSTITMLPDTGGANLFEEGMTLEARELITGSPAVRDSFSNHRLTVVNKKTRVMTYINGVTGVADNRALVAGDHIFISGTYDFNQVTMMSAFDDGSAWSGTFQGIDRSTEPKLQAVVDGTGPTRPPSEDLFLRLAAGRWLDRSRHTLDCVWTTPGVENEFFRLVASQRLYSSSASGDVRYSTGFKPGTIPIKGAGIDAMIKGYRYIRPGTAFMFPMHTLSLWISSDLHWLDGDGSTERFVLSNGERTFAVESTYAGHETPIVEDPGSGIRVQNLTDLLTP